MPAGVRLVSHESLTERQGVRSYPYQTRESTKIHETVVGVSEEIAETVVGLQQLPFSSRSYGAR